MIVAQLFAPLFIRVHPWNSFGLNPCFLVSNGGKTACWNFAEMKNQKTMQELAEFLGLS